MSGMSKVIAARNFRLGSLDRDAFSIINKMIYHAAVRDRFNILNRLSSINWSDRADEIPKPYDEQVSFGLLIDNRMTSILDKYKEGNIVIAQSGGVDSTAIICAYLCLEADIKRLIVVCTSDSIEEYPFFYELMKKHGINIRIVDEVTEELSDIDCAVILTGWCADQLFGSDVNMRNTSLYNMPQIDALRIFAKDVKNTPLSERSLKIINEVYTDYASKLGLKIEQWCEFLWLVNFGCKWSYVQNETNLSLAETKNYGKAVAFYEDISFQRQAISNFPNLRKHNPYLNSLYYKKPLKQYILNYTSDIRYFRRKGKMATRYLTNIDLDHVSVLTEEGVKIFKAVENRGCTGCMYQAVTNKFRKENR